MTVRIDQLADAIYNAPGISVQILEAVNNADTTTSATFVTLDAATTQKTFLAPLAGKYRFILTADCFATGNAAAATFRIVIDKGLATEQVTPDSFEWSITHTTLSEHLFRTFFYDFNLTADSHTFEVQWRRSSGTGTMAVSTLSGMQCYAQLISGSGAGGTILGTGTVSSPVALGGSFALVTGLSTTVTTMASETIEIVVTAVATKTTANGTVIFTVYIDGVNIDDPTFGYSMLTMTSTWSAAQSFSRVYTMPTAGSHTVQIYARYNVSGANIISGTLTVLQRRGGLVPIRQDGVDKVGQPRALDFIGAGVYQVSEGTGEDAGVAKIELNEAITSVGSTVEMMRWIPGGTYTSSSVSYVDIHATAESTFTTPYAGVYLLEFVCDVYGTTGPTAAGMQLVFDAAGVTPQTIGNDDGTWALTSPASNARGNRTFITVVTLTAGSHTVKPQWKKLGTNDMSVNTGSGYLLRGTLVSGSGAGGLLVTRLSHADFLVTDAYINDVSPYIMFNQSITTIANEQVLITYAGQTRNLQAGTFQPRVKLKVDGVEAQQYNDQAGQWLYQNMSFAYVTEPLSAGSHTITFEVSKLSATNVNGYIYNNKLHITQFRGGLVPIRKDGVTVVDKPAAIDFNGPGFQVVNNGGTATVLLENTAEGTILGYADNGTLSDSTRYPSFVDIPSMSVTFNTVGGEYILVVFTGCISSDATSSSIYTRLVTDGVAEAGSVRTSGTFGRNQSYSRVYGPFTAGSHTIKVQASTSAGTMSSTAGECRLYIHQYRGGYVQPENIPLLVYSTASQINIQSAPGAPTRLYLLLNNGVRYSATSPLVLNMATTGLGGREVSSNPEAIDTWYYIYAVPNTALTDNSFTVVASVNSPATGPNDYSIWRYLGFVRNNHTSNIKPFDYRAPGIFRYRNPSDSDIVIYSEAAGTPATGSWLNLTLTSAVPISVTGVVNVEGVIDSDPGGNHMMMLDAGNPPAWTPSLISDNPIAYAQEAGGHTFTKIINLFDGTLSRFWVSRTGNVDIQVLVREIYDKYLVSQESQTQAQFVPDTLTPLGTWLTTTTIGFGSRPNQPATTRLTLQDNRQRIMTTGTWAVANGVADWGYDEAASQGNSKWLYFYAVPLATDSNQLTIRASDNDPTVGPTGYSNWCYVWSDYMTSGAVLRRIFQRGNRFFYPDLSTEGNRISLTGGVVGTTTLSLASYVPATTSLALLQVYTLYGSSYAATYVSPVGWDALGKYFGVYGQTATANAGRGYVEMPLVGSTSIDYSGTGTGSTRDLNVMGWVDDYISIGIGGGPTGNTLNGAYNSGGSGSGRIITVNAGPVEMNASGGQALKMDGYLALAEKTTDPIAARNKGMVYSKDVAGRTELMYEDDAYGVTEITKTGSVLVTKIQERSVSTAAPSDGFVLAWNNTASMWSPQIQDGYKIQTRDISSRLPTDGQALVWNNAGSMWSPQTQDGYKIQTRDISPRLPTDGQALVWNNAGNMWSPQIQDGYKIQTRDISPRVPTDGYALVWNNAGNMWSPQIQDAYMIQGRYVASTIPSDGYAMVWNNTFSQWEPQRIVRRAVEQELISSGTETEIALTSTPISAQNIQLFRNGNRMRRMTAVPTTVSQWRYNASLNKVEFLATGDIEEYVVWYLI